MATPDCHQDECHPGHHHVDGCGSDAEHTTSGAGHAHQHPAVRMDVDWNHASVALGGLTPTEQSALAQVAVRLQPMPAPAVELALPEISASPPLLRRHFLTSILLI